MIKPIIYLDTNIILDCIDKRNTHSINALGKIQKNRWRCITSEYLSLELIDTKKEEQYIKNKLGKIPIRKILSGRDQLDLSKKDFQKIKAKIERNWINKYNFIYYHDLTAKGWIEAEDICINSNLWSGDIIHIATAYEAKCNVILTGDSFFIKEGTDLLKRGGLHKKMRICLPEDLDKNLCDLGFILKPGNKK